MAVKIVFTCILLLWAVYHICQIGLAKQRMKSANVVWHKKNKLLRKVCLIQKDLDKLTEAIPTTTTTTNEELLENIKQYRIKMQEVTALLKECDELG